MASSDSISVVVTNQLDVELVVYNTTVPDPTDPPSTDPDAYYPTYVQLGTVPANGTAPIDTGEILSRLVMTRATDDFPVKLFVPDILGALTQPVTVVAADQANTETAWRFYKDYKAQPYAPMALQYNALVLDDANVLTLDTQVAALLTEYGYDGADYDDVSMVSYWACNSLQAWPGTYYGYAPPPSTAGGGFIVPDSQVATLVVGSDGSATYTPTDGGPSYSGLTFSDNTLSSPGADGTSGLSLTGVVRDLTWEDQPSQVELFWVGTRDGAQCVLQPYQDPDLPWWAAAYNLAFATYLAVEIVIVVDMATHVLQGVTNGISWLSENAETLYGNIRSTFEDISAEADPEAAVGDDIDPINVDVDVDVDIDVDVVTDTDNVTDTDVDVDIDIDVDIDDDVFAIIDVDVDVDVDIDTDVVTDTDNVTDTDTDTDTDIDTDVDVQPGGVSNLLNTVGNWMMNEGFPAIAKNLLIMGAMTGTQTLLNVWKDQDEQDLDNMSPQESTGLGLLLNYMLTDSVPIQERWETFADFVEQDGPDVPSQQMFMSSLLMFQNAVADQAQADWRWSQDAEDALVDEMAQYSAPDQQYRAYQTLAASTYQGSPLPVKVGASVSIHYLAKIG